MVERKFIAPVEDVSSADSGRMRWVPGAPAVSQVLDAFKDLGFQYATQAGITVSKNNVVSPPEKPEILERYE